MLLIGLSQHAASLQALAAHYPGVGGVGGHSSLPQHLMPPAQALLQYQQLAAAATLGRSQSQTKFQITKLNPSFSVNRAKMVIIPYFPQPPNPTHGKASKISQTLRFSSYKKTLKQFVSPV